MINDTYDYVCFYRPFYRSEQLIIRPTDTSLYVHKNTGSSYGNTSYGPVFPLPLLLEVNEADQV
jgi:hypothetical protein